MNVRAAVSSVVKLAFASLMAVGVAGCADGTPVGVEVRPGGLQVGEVARAVLLTEHHPAGVYNMTIGSGGGQLEFGSGNITFPAGSVEQPTLISATVDGTSLKVTFSPHGLVFSRHAPPKLTFYIQDASIPRERLQIAYVDMAGRVQELQDTFLTSDGDEAFARIKHFSTYVMGAH